MFDNRLLTAKLAEMGCSKRARLEYDMPRRIPRLRWALGFRLLGVYRWEIDGAVRCTHETASPFADRCMRELAGEWWANAAVGHDDLFSGIGFPIAKLAPWGVTHGLSIKDYTAEESTSRIAHDVRAFVLPFVESVTSELDYLHHLLEDREPMQWLFSQPLARFAEAAWLCTQLDQPTELALLALEREHRFAQNQLRDLPLQEYSDRVIRAARVGA